MKPNLNESSAFDWRASLNKAFHQKENAPVSRGGVLQNHQNNTDFSRNRQPDARKLHEILGTKFRGKTKPSGERMALCPFHCDDNPSMSVNLNTGLFKCFACDVGGDSFSFYQRLKGCDFKTAKADFVSVGV